MVAHKTLKRDQGLFLCKLVIVVVITGANRISELKALEICFR